MRLLARQSEAAAGALEHLEAGLTTMRALIVGARNDRRALSASTDASGCWCGDAAAARRFVGRCVAAVARLHPATLGLQNFASCGAPVYLRVIWNTIAISAIATPICVLLGFPVAHAMTYGSARVRRWLIFLVLLRSGPASWCAPSPP